MSYPKKMKWNEMKWNTSGKGKDYALATGKKSIGSQELCLKKEEGV
jgi:hypothetical protein